mmetsp:Transcript_75568/g.209978  ORF Transcript_75568/g.209978 Transcript_75568/m.209978 type:complete len:93 (+) Transcript_75568:29-307(+)
MPAVSTGIRGMQTATPACLRARPPAAAAAGSRQKICDAMKESQGAEPRMAAHCACKALTLERRNEATEKANEAATAQTTIQCALCDKVESKT